MAEVNAIVLKTETIVRWLNQKRGREGRKKIRQIAD